MSQPGNPLHVFVTTAPGLEGALAGELNRLGFSSVAKGRAGVSLRADRVGLERLTASSRLAHRVLWTLGEVDARDADSLYRGVFDLVRWPGLVPRGKTLAVFATARDTAAFRDHRFVALKTKDAIVDAVRDATGERPDIDPEDPDVLVRVSVARGRGVVSLDAAGRTSLHARGYRTDAGEAPLRETLAAALPLLAGWDGAAPLLDPMCGSGTILIEAALSARRVLPGHLRRGYGFMRWPGFRAERYEAWLASSRAAVVASGSPELPPMAGSDWDEAVLATARVNAERAGVANDLALSLADATRLEVPAELAARPGWVITNPPWGARLGDEAATRELLARAAARWREVLPGWQAAVLVPDRALADALGLASPRLVPLESGGKDVLLAVGKL